MEVVWKVVTFILNHHLATYIAFHDILHGFQAGRCTRTTSIKSKLLHQLMNMREEVLSVIFLDLQKVYDALDRYILMEILEGYGVGLRNCCIFRHYWYRLTMVDHAGRYYREALRGVRGVTQGYLLPPTIFNIAMDAVV